MLTLAPRWSLDVTRGPDWLIIKPIPPQRNLADAPPLADQLWATLDQHFTYRLVLDLSQIGRLQNAILGQLSSVNARIQSHGGLLRL